MAEKKSVPQAGGAEPSRRKKADEEDLGALTRGLVREYLARNGFRQTLESYDQEAGAGTSVKSSVELLRTLRLRKLHQQNRSREEPYKSVLELLAHYLFRRSAEAQLEAALDAAAGEQPTGPKAASRPDGPSAPAAPPAAAPAGGKKSSFWENLQKAKAAKAAAEAAKQQAEAGAEAPQRKHEDADPVAAASKPAAANEASATGDASAAAPGAEQPKKSSFWENLQRKRREAAAAAGDAEEQPATQPPSAPVPPPAAAPTPAPAPATGGGKGSFWERVQAQRAAAAAAAGDKPEAEAPAEATAPPAPAAAGQYRAPDGKTFSDRSEWRKYVFEKFYTFADKEGQTLTKAPGEVDGQAFSMRDLKNCELRLLDHSETVQVDRVEDCRIFIAASCGSVFLRHVKNCTITVACKQLRTRDCEDCRVFLYAKTDPVIEASTRMHFAPFNGACPRLADSFRQASLDPDHNQWRRIFDFHKGDPTYPEPHFTVEADIAGVEDWVVDVEGQPAAENPVARDAEEDADEATQRPGGATISKGSVFASFDIRSVSREQAEKRLEQLTAAAGGGDQAE